jgi:hypothetical protein
MVAWAVQHHDAIRAARAAFDGPNDAPERIAG